MAEEPAGYSTWGHKELDMTECVYTHTHTHPTCNEFLIEYHTPMRLTEANQLVDKKLE